MDFLLGLLVGAVFFVGYFAYKAGQRTTKKAPVDDEVKKKAEKMHRDFSQLMSYDVSTAIRKKVT